MKEEQILVVVVLVVVYRITSYIFLGLKSIPRTATYIDYAIHTYWLYMY